MQSFNPSSDNSFDKLEKNFVPFCSVSEITDKSKETDKIHRAYEILALSVFYYYEAYGVHSFSLYEIYRCYKKFFTKTNLSPIESYGRINQILTDALERLSSTWKIIEKKFVRTGNSPTFKYSLLPDSPQLTEENSSHLKSVIATPENRALYETAKKWLSALSALKPSAFSRIVKNNNNNNSRNEDTIFFRNSQKHPLIKIMEYINYDKIAQQTQKAITDDLNNLDIVMSSAKNRPAKISTGFDLTFHDQTKKARAMSLAGDIEVEKTFPVIDSGTLPNNILYQTNAMDTEEESQSTPIIEIRSTSLLYKPANERLKELFKLDSSIQFDDNNLQDILNNSVQQYQSNEEMHPATRLMKTKKFSGEKNESLKQEIKKIEANFKKISKNKKEAVELKKSFITDFNKTLDGLKNNFEKAQLLFSLGLLHSSSRNYKKAITCFKKSLILYLDISHNRTWRDNDNILLIAFHLEQNMKLYADKIRNAVERKTGNMRDPVTGILRDDFDDSFEEIIPDFTEEVKPFVKNVQPYLKAYGNALVICEIVQEDKSNYSQIGLTGKQVNTYVENFEKECGALRRQGNELVKKKLELAQRQYIESAKENPEIALNMSGFFAKKIENEAPITTAPAVNKRRKVTDITGKDPVGNALGELVRTEANPPAIEQQQQTNDEVEVSSTTIVNA